MAARVRGLHRGAIPMCPIRGCVDTDLLDLRTGEWSSVDATSASGDGYKLYLSPSVLYNDTLFRFGGRDEVNVFGSVWGLHLRNLTWVAYPELDYP